jgi:hypothetical protein
LHAAIDALIIIMNVNINIWPVKNAKNVSDVPIDVDGAAMDGARYYLLIYIV